jgi:hypothetical protein
MTPFLFLELAVKPALSLLPPAMDSTAARAFVIAICLQESELKARRQLPAGPARGYAQFERPGVAGVLTHAASRQHALAVCHDLDIVPAQSAVHAALQYQDVLCAAFARLLLWTLPQPLPGRDEAPEGWEQYLSAWRPGKPRQSTWLANYQRGWQIAANALADTAVAGRGRHAEERAQERIVLRAHKLLAR